MKNAYDHSKVKSVTAVALAYDGRQAGKIVANWSDNPKGSVCTATVSLWYGPLKGLPKTTARAGGYGYDKFSHCLESIFGDNCPGSGRESIYAWLESKGYSVYPCC